MTTEAGVYVGWLRHRRFAPVAHEFSYPLFMVLVDIDRLPELMRVSPFTSYNRWNWASFNERDHFGDPSRSLRERVALDAARHGLVLPDGPVFLVTHLRYLGYCFNPVSFFYCYDAQGALDLVLAEVNNTFGGSHNYWLQHSTDQRAPDAVFRSTAEKSLYVSPFLETGLDYTFALTPAADRLVAHMRVSKTGGLLFDATLSLERRPWTSGEIHRALLRHPMMTAKVVGGIHWEAMRLWWKGVPAVARKTPDGVADSSAAASAPLE